MFFLRALSTTSAKDGRCIFDEIFLKHPNNGPGYTRARLFLYIYKIFYTATVSAMLFSNSTNNDALISVLQHMGDLNSLGLMSIVSRSMNKLLTDSVQGRNLLLNQAIGATAGVEHFDADEIRSRFERIDARVDFLWNMRLLVCPWHALGVVLPLKLGSRDFHARHISLSDDDQRIYFQKADNTETRWSFPSRHTDGFVSKVNLSEPWVAPRIEKHDDKYDDLAALVADKKIVPDHSHDRGCKYQFFSIHAGAYAVMETFSRTFDNGPDFSDDGVYFFSHKDGRMLRHIKIDSIAQDKGCCILSRPTELWILTCLDVEYSGPSCCPRPVLINDKLDPAFWMAGRGDAHGAINFLQNMQVPLDSRCLISNRTLFHYLAKEGHGDGIRLVINSGFTDVDATDDFDNTALEMAVAELHLDAVDALINTGSAESVREDAGSVLTVIGDFVQYKPYSALPERINDEINRLVPGIVDLLLKDSVCVVNCINSYITQTSIMSSPAAVRMICASGQVEPDLAEIACTFGNFRSRIHELKAVESLCVLASEFKVNINTAEDPEDYELAVISLAKNAIAEAFIMAVDNLGADTTVKDSGGKSIRQIAEERSRRAGDVDGRRILAFLDSRGL